MRILLTVLFLLMYTTSPVHAVREFTVNPPIIELKQQTRNQITITNRSSEELTIEHSLVSLQSDTTGILTPITKVSIPSTITLEGTNDSNTIILTPNTSKSLVLTYIPPVSHENDLLGIEFTSISKDTADDRSMSKLESAIIVPLIISNPNAYSHLSNVMFSAPVFIGNNSVAFDIAAQNTGENPIKVVGTVTIRNILRHTVASFDITPRYLLSGQTREFLDTKGSKLTWDPTLLIGFYQAELRLQYNNEEIVERQILVGVPVKQTIILFSCLLILSGIYLRVRKYL